VTLPSGAGATQTTMLSRLTGVVDQYMTGTDNAELSAFLCPRQGLRLGTTVLLHGRCSN
jgi:hypothetical protein